MKKLLSVFLVLGLGILLVAGCGGEQVTTTTTTTSATTTTTGGEITQALEMATASLIAVLAKDAGIVDASMLYPALLATSPEINVVGAGWWSAASDAFGYHLDYKAKIWTAGPTLVDDDPSLLAVKNNWNLVEKVWMALTITSTTGATTEITKVGTAPTEAGSYQIVYGDPKTAQGPIISEEQEGGSVTHSLQADADMSFVGTYPNIYPSGTVTFHYSEVGVAFNVNGTFDGTVNAEVGPFPSGRRYSVNLLTFTPTLIP